MKNNKGYDEAAFNNFVLVTFNDVVYEVVCTATGRIYSNTYEDGYVDYEIDDVTPCITSIYDTNEQKYVTSKLKDNEDFTDLVCQALVDAFNDGSDEWENIDGAIREQQRENQLYWECEKAEKDFNA
jgi:hypothetical protein